MTGPVATTLHAVRPWLAVGLAAAALVVALSRSEGPLAPADAGARPERHSPPRDDLERRLDDIERRLQTAEAGMGRSEVVDRDRVRQLVEELMATRTAPPALPTATGRVATDPVATAALLQQLAAAADDSERAAIWARIQQMGAVDVAVEHFRQLADANPLSADAQTQLGTALVQKMLASTTDTERIELGKQIEAQYDRALTLEPDHWEARFRKAVGLSHGTALSGRRTEAIAEFEQLVRQQAGQPSQPGFAATYVFLGRLYQEQGDTARAQAMWQQGIARHPDDQQLRQLTQGR